MTTFIEDSGGCLRQRSLEQIMIPSNMYPYWLGPPLLSYLTQYSIRQTSLRVLAKNSFDTFHTAFQVATFTRLLKQQVLQILKPLLMPNFSRLLEALRLVTNLLRCEVEAQDARADISE
jgi:hypothetical protein